MALEQYHEVLAAGNKLAYAHSERILGPKKIRVFRKVLNGGDHPCKEQILEANCPEIQKVYEVHDEIFYLPIITRIQKCQTKKYGPLADELMQDSCIATSNAILSYRNLDVKLSTYITHCIKRQLISCWRATQSKRHIFQTDLDRGDMLYEFVQPTHNTLYDEEVMAKAISGLRPFERAVVDAYLEGKSLAKLGREYNVSRMQVWNTFETAKEKIKWVILHHDGLLIKGGQYV